MHEIHKLEDIKEENEKNGAYPPDRQRFESDLANTHAEMKKFQNDIHRLRKTFTVPNTRKTELIAMKTNLNEQLKSRCLRKSNILWHSCTNTSTIKQLAAESDEIKLKIENKRKLQLDLEKDCRFRKKESLERHLAIAENRYATKTLSLRDEQALVNELDALRRNRTKLLALEEMIAEKKQLENELKELKMKKNKIYHEISIAHAEIMKYKKETRMNRLEIDSCHKALNTLKEERRKLIESYEIDRAEYTTWVSEKKQTHGGSTVPSTFPNTRKKTFIEDEELEPFYEGKRDCRRLIHYLEGLKNNAQQETTKIPIQATKSIDTDEDSADELPPNLANLLNGNVKPCVTGIRKHLKKPTQPISHNLEIYKLFGAVEVEVPTLYNEVPEALENVKEKLAFYEQQTTNEIDWGDEFPDNDDPMTASASISDMESTFFDDSISEVGSMSSSFRGASRSSCQSPLHYT